MILRGAASGANSVLTMPIITPAEHEAPDRRRHHDEAFRPRDEADRLAQARHPDEGEHRQQLEPEMGDPERNPSESVHEPGEAETVRSPRAGLFGQRGVGRARPRLARLRLRRLVGRGRRRPAAGEARECRNRPLDQPPDDDHRGEGQRQDRHQPPDAVEDHRAQVGIVRDPVHPGAELLEVGKRLGRVVRLRGKARAERPDVAEQLGPEDCAGASPAGEAVVVAAVARTRLFSVVVNAARLAGSFSTPQQLPHLGRRQSGRGRRRG